jgi:hypothetical protein
VFLIPEPTVKQRIVRASGRLLRSAPFEVPQGKELRSAVLGAFGHLSDLQRGYWRHDDWMRSENAIAAYEAGGLCNRIPPATPVSRPGLRESSGQSRYGRPRASSFDPLPLGVPIDHINEVSSSADALQMIQTSVRLRWPTFEGLPSPSGWHRDQAA